MKKLRNNRDYKKMLIRENWRIIKKSSKNGSRLIESIRSKE
jgi:hypothetical protein